MIYIILLSVVILIAILVYQYVTLTRLYYFNSSLHLFKELRHKSTLFIIDKVEVLPFSELQEHHEFLKFVNNIVEKFDSIKYDVSRFEFVKAIYKQVIFSSNTFEQIKYEHCESLDDFKTDYTRSLNELFKAIPFLRTRIVVDILRLLCLLLIQIGFIKLRRNVLAIDKLVHAQENISNGCLN